ncbi:hypothetical protein D3C76_322920 [compost metagenome]|uniref:hypothetical protein n=1 Tax=Pseudomonas sp. ACN8 TaxID=1920428 RepID=UPI000BB39D6E|nr:hypothetical protein [Pseudomonas sp. ACN8]PBJ18414.1 hypothetical protein BSF44_51560 [Pseudomonas sp. ACN8]
MKTALKIAFISLMGALQISCAEVSINRNLLEARELFTLLHKKPESYWLAYDEVNEAFAVLIQADLLSNEDAGAPEIDQLSQLAKQKIALAEQAISDRKSEQLFLNPPLDR